MPSNIPCYGVPLQKQKWPRSKEPMNDEFPVSTALLKGHKSGSQIARQIDRSDDNKTALLSSSCCFSGFVIFYPM